MIKVELEQDSVAKNGTCSKKKTGKVGLREKRFKEERKKRKRRGLKMLKRFLSEDFGQGMVEYGLIIALVAVVLIGMLTSMSGGLDGLFQTVTNAL
jgi:pilus assembly protein Flp/PilA